MGDPRESHDRLWHRADEFEPSRWTEATSPENPSTVLTIVLCSLSFWNVRVRGWIADVSTADRFATDLSDSCTVAAAVETRYGS